jgi:hypothetical protein
MVVEDRNLKKDSDNWFLKLITMGRFLAKNTFVVKIILLFVVGVLLFGVCVAQGVLMTLEIDKSIKNELAIGITEIEAEDALDRIKFAKSKYIKSSRYVSVEKSPGEWDLTVSGGDIYSCWTLSFNEGVLVKRTKHKRQLATNPK